MQILQGQYLKSLQSSKGRLKGIQIKTAEGAQVIEIPKALSAIASTEITIGDNIRLWVTKPKATQPKKSGRKKADKKKKPANKSPQQEKSLIALQIIPLSPKPKVTLPQIAKKDTAKKDIKNKAKKKTKATKRATKPLTVQLCQKKNCCKKGGDKLWAAFEAAAQDAQTNANRRPFNLEAVGCLGGCKNGPNIRLLPANVKHRSVKPSDIPTLVSRQG